MTTVIYRPTAAISASAHWHQSRFFALVLFTHHDGVRIRYSWIILPFNYDRRKSPSFTCSLHFSQAAAFCFACSSISIAELWNSSPLRSLPYQSSNSRFPDFMFLKMSLIFCHMHPLKNNGCPHPNHCSLHPCTPPLCFLQCRDKRCFSGFISRISCPGGC